MEEALPRILISNDDGVSAPGLRALVEALNSHKFCEIYVCGPFGERSGQSQSITLGKHLHAFSIDVPGSVEAYAVDGSPADSVIVALRSNLLSTRDFALIVSGINRGDNAGLHVIYSGTVGAAREGACTNYPALALSLDSHSARSKEQYEQAAQCSVAFIKAMLGASGRKSGSSLPGVASCLYGQVLNVNVPEGPREAISGIALCRQGYQCSDSTLVECESDPAFAEIHGHKDQEIRIGDVQVRAYRHKFLVPKEDFSQGSDSEALRKGWVSVTPIGKFSDHPLSEEAAKRRYNHDVICEVKDIIQHAAAFLQVKYTYDLL